MKTTSKIFLIIFQLFSCFSFSQVGINTNAPQTTLHVAAPDSGFSNNVGLTIPVVTVDMNTAGAGISVSQLVYSTNASSTGFYYWNDISWQPLKTVNTDTQNLSKAGNTISLVDGGSVDISTTTPADGEVLTWNGTSSEWQATPASGGSGGIGSLSTDFIDVKSFTAVPGTIYYILINNGSHTITLPECNASNQKKGIVVFPVGGTTFAIPITYVSTSPINGINGSSTNDSRAACFNGTWYLRHT